jgi:hypothetical protein
LVLKFNLISSSNLIYITMNKLIASLIVGVSLAGLAMADSGARSSSDDSDWTVERGFAATGDVLLVRPLGAAVTIASFGIFAVASPFAAMADATEQVYDTLVTNPGEYTFCRDLGCFDCK